MAKPVVDIASTAAKSFADVIVTVFPDPEDIMPSLANVTIFRMFAEGVAVPESVGKDVGVVAEAVIVKTAPAPDVDTPAPPTTEKLFNVGVTVPESVVIEVGIAGCSVISKLMVTVAPEALVSIPLVPPKILMLLEDGVAVPESPVKVVGTVEPADIVGLPDTPSPFDIETPEPAVMVRVVQVSVAVLVAKPVVEIPSTAAKSLANAKVGFPATPVAFEMVIPAAGGISVLPKNVPKPS